MSRMQDQVLEFHEACKLTIGERAHPAIRDAELRCSLIEEEAKETVEAIRRGDLVEAVDGLCDTLYVVFGTAVAFGADFHAQWESWPPFEPQAPAIRGLPLVADQIEQIADTAVHKIRSGDLFLACNYCIALICACLRAAREFGIDIVPFFAEVHRTNLLKTTGPVREDGKRLKPPGWQPPRIAEMLKELKDARSGVTPAR